MTSPTPQPLALKILVGVALLGLLYMGRDVFEPIALAMMLGFVMAPIVHRIRRLGLGQAPAAIVALLLVGAVVGAIGSVIVGQLGDLSQELPRYENNVRQKIGTLRETMLRPLQEVQGRAGRIVGDLGPAPSAEPAAPQPADDGASVSLAGQLVAAVWGPLGFVGVVVLVLVFALLEQGALRDRLVRLVGGRDLRAATSALDDAGQRLSRYFISQFAVNAGVGLAIGGLLALLGVPHAAVWAVLGGLLRFVPYVGFPAAALLAGAMAAAMVPGWELMLQTLAVFLAVELAAAYVVEPQLYGHTTGLSPFSVVVAAIFWGALWGPVGLLLSTPLTLCLVVAGRHVPSLAFLDLLLGDAPALDLSQRFYQRSISGDAVEILADARAFLKRKPLAAYCDKVVMPAFELARQDFERQQISPQQQAAAQRVILQVLAELTRSPLPARRRAAVLDGSGLGLRLRRERESVEGRWQGPLDVPPGSLMLCVSLPDPGSELSAELLVRVLRSERLDARHATVKELAEVPPDARADAVGVVFVVCSGEASAEDVGALDACLAQLPQARVVALLPAQMAAQPPRDPLSSERHHHTAYSFEEALSLVQRRPA
ncbi:AI-2E family transporter [Rubrivivax gelatinosus]|uniref:Putative PurR-regulated permease PerM n=1 Tax=Rubrivivax gelatinosus TaxID=28068 RepID=A0A4R2ME67_RUBGE|nr:AI-2E family transporter [Rubrivivax gelatinosus]MBK1687604.1 hypothetical protein [Rubrivivax gelatinosus]TCP02977.1 putative PurR-regulated permease PerM [Rubrivivax gelatinosus]